MSPITHLLTSWVIAAKTTDNARDCRLVTLAGIAPDLDGLGLIADVFGPRLGFPQTQYYADYHHFLLHGAFGAVVVSALLALGARQRWRVFGLALIVFHMHLLCDLIGSRGPAPEDLWFIFYLGPFSHEPMWVFPGQFPMNAWPMRVVTVLLLGWSFLIAVRRGGSVVGTFNHRADAVFVATLRKWCGMAGGSAPKSFGTECPNG